MTFSRIVKLLAYLTVLAFIINRIVDRPAKPEKPKEQPKLEVPAYVSESQDARALVVGGRKFLEEGKLEYAEAAFARASELDPKFRDAFLHLGLTRLELKQYFEAELALRRARAIDPLYVKTHEALARLYEQTGQKELAEETQKRVEEFSK